VALTVQKCSLWSGKYQITVQKCEWGVLETDHLLFNSSLIGIHRMLMRVYVSMSYLLHSIANLPTSCVDVGGLPVTHYWQINKFIFVTWATKHRRIHNNKQMLNCPRLIKLTQICVVAAISLPFCSIVSRLTFLKFGLSFILHPPILLCSSDDCFLFLVLFIR
jgi:hypothetical protein